MSYRIRVYAPTVGVNLVSLYTWSGSLVTSSAPAGESTPCIDEDYVSASTRITASLQDGYQVKQWIISEDGVVTYQTSATCTYTIGTATNVQIRLEVQQQTVYYANIAFSANGGSNAPNTLYGSSYDNYIVFTLPYTVPTRDGYTFLGWHRSQSYTVPEYYPGSQVTITNVSTVYPGPTFTLYAVWELITDDGVIYIYDGATFYKYKPYIYTNGWQEAIPYIFDSGTWRKSQ